MNTKAIHSARGKSQMDQTRDIVRAGRYLGDGAFIGAIGGVVGTLVMDLVLMAALSVVGLPALTCFSIVGDTVAGFVALLGLDVAGGVLLGIASHYLIGPMVGAIFGVAVTRIDALQVDTLKKGVLLAVVYVEVLSQPMLALPPLLLKMTVSETLEWFGGSFVMHLIAGAVLGLVVSKGLVETHSRDHSAPTGRKNTAWWKGTHGESSNLGVPSVSNVFSRRLLCLSRVFEKR